VEENTVTRLDAILEIEVSPLAGRRLLLIPLPPPNWGGNDGLQNCSIFGFNVPHIFPFEKSRIKASLGDAVDSAFVVKISN